MRFHSLALLTVLLVTQAAADGGVVRLSEPVASDAESETFGAPLTAGTPTLALSEVLADADRYVDSPVLVTARVSQVCQKKGCFFIAKDAGSVVRVSFRDYSFFIPTDSGGKEVTFEGVLERVAVSEEDAEHYDADVGEATGLASGPQFTFVASAVRVPR